MHCTPTFVVNHYFVGCRNGGTFFCANPYLCVILLNVLLGELFFVVVNTF